MIFVLKDDGTSERFEPAKLRGCLLRVLEAGGEDLRCARALSAAVGCYLVRRRIRCLSSAAVFEMALTALRARDVRYLVRWPWQNRYLEERLLDLPRTYRDRHVAIYEVPVEPGALPPAAARFTPAAPRPEAR